MNAVVLFLFFFFRRALLGTLSIMCRFGARFIARMGCRISHGFRRRRVHVREPPRTEAHHVSDLTARNNNNYKKKKMRLVALMISVLGRASNSATVSRYEGFKFIC